MTLIEVLGGLLILSSLLVVVLVARDRHIRQARLATQRIEATNVADGLLTTWWETPDDFPRNSGGTAGGRWRWQTRDATDADARRLGLDVVRLRVWPAGDDRAVPVSIDVVLPPGVTR